MDAPVTLITGTRKGIGRHLAEHYVRSGHRVVGCSRGEVDWAADGYTHYIADVSDEPAVKRIFTDIRRKYGRLDHLVNNAGIASMNHSLLTPLSTVNAVLDTNVVGTFLFCREAAKLMKAAEPEMLFGPDQARRYPVPGPEIIGHAHVLGRVVLDE